MQNRITPNEYLIAKNISRAFTVDFISCLEDWEPDGGYISSKGSPASKVFNTIIDDTSLYLNPVAGLPLGRFPVRQYDEDTVDVISKILNGSIRKNHDST